MTARTKNAIYSLILVVAVFAVWKYRQSSHGSPIQIEGKTMGTTYHITYFDKKKRNFKNEVDSILVLVNKSISTWDSTSEISRFNRSEHSLKFDLPYFYPPLKISQQVVSNSHGAYDPTVMPLVNAWGFGPKKITNPDTATVERVKNMSGLKN